MENIKLQKGYNVPFISFDAKTGELKMAGRAHPENAESTFNPLIEWVEKYTESPAPDTTFEIDLEYFNSSASKTLYKIFSDLIEISDRTNLTVKWHYYDEDSLEVANDYETILGFKMVLIDATER